MEAMNGAPTRPHLSPVTKLYLPCDCATKHGSVEIQTLRSTHSATEHRCIVPLCLYKPPRHTPNRVGCYLRLSHCDAGRAVHLNGWRQSKDLHQKCYRPSQRLERASELSYLAHCAVSHHSVCCFSSHSAVSFPELCVSLRCLSSDLTLRVPLVRQVVFSGQS